MNGLARAEIDGLAANSDRLPPPAGEVHFDPLALAIVKGAMLEGVEIDIGPQLAVDARQQVEVELRGDPGRVVVGGVKDGGVLDEIGADDEHRGGPEQARRLREEPASFLRLEIADRGTGK